MSPPLVIKSEIRLEYLKGWTQIVIIVWCGWRFRSIDSAFISELKWWPQAHHWVSLSFTLWYQSFKTDRIEITTGFLFQVIRRTECSFVGVQCDMMRSMSSVMIVARFSSADTYCNHLWSAKPSKCCNWGSAYKETSTPRYPFWKRTPQVVWNVEARRLKFGRSQSW